MAQSEFRIGEVAERAGVSIDTVRYYERRRLLPCAPRTQGGFRVFTGDAVERVCFIKQAQELGFSLDEISTLLTTGGGAK
jgi:DNA-binding transcriptional MerR regulator